VLHVVMARVAALGFEKKILLYAGVLSIVPIFGFVLGGNREAPPVERGQPADVTTMIPKGFVLVPIEVQNYEALDSILGRFGIVDLFQAPTHEGSTQHLVARNVRILRAPQNPTHFAVLVMEEKVGEILRGGGLFTVIVKRPAEDGTEFVIHDKPKRRKIVYGGD
jgi:hypothetical protein